MRLYQTLKLLHSKRNQQRNSCFNLLSFIGSHSKWNNVQVLSKSPLFPTPANYPSGLENRPEEEDCAVLEADLGCLRRQFQDPGLEVGREHTSPWSHRFLVLCGKRCSWKSVRGGARVGVPLPWVWVVLPYTFTTTTITTYYYQHRWYNCPLCPTVPFKRSQSRWGIKRHKTWHWEW